MREPEARRGLGFVPENPSLQDFLTPYEILLMGLRLHGLRLGDERKHCMHWLERLDLAAVADSRLRGFSKGMLQRTALAHALAIKPRLLILDEPLSGLDPVGRKDVVDILDEYRRQGGTLFFSSHVLHDVERIADRFGLIHQGQLLTIRSPQELAADQAGTYVLSYRGGARRWQVVSKCGRAFMQSMSVPPNCLALSQKSSPVGVSFRKSKPAFRSRPSFSGPSHRVTGHTARYAGRLAPAPGSTPVRLCQSIEKIA